MRFLLSLVMAVSLAQQTPPPVPPAKPAPPGTAQTPATVPVAPTQGPFEFTSDLGAFLIVVKSDKAAVFDGAVAKLKQALTQGNATATRKQQANGWRVLKSTETPTDGTLTYLFLIEPVVKQASYDPIVILRESLPNDVQSAYDQFKDGIVSMTRIGLKELMKMGGS